MNRFERIYIRNIGNINIVDTEDRMEEFLDK